MRASVRGDDANVVNRFLHDRHVSLPLHDLQIAVIAHGKHGRPFVGPQDAVFGETAILGAVELMSLPRGRPVGISLHRFRRHGGDLTIGWIRDERRPMIGRHFHLALV